MKVNNKGGSFGIPEDLMEELNNVRTQSKKGSFDIPKQPAEPKPEPQPKTEEPAKEKKEEKIEEKSEKEKQEELIASIKKELNIELSEDDLWNAMFNSTLTKKDICIFPRKMNATFKYSLSVFPDGEGR